MSMEMMDFIAGLVLGGIMVVAFVGVLLIWFDHRLKTQRMEQLEKYILEKGLPEFLGQTKNWTKELTMEMTSDMFKTVKELNESEY